MELKTDSLDVAAGGKKLVSGLELTVTSGQCWFVYGRNGAGKTTLLQTLAGIPVFHSRPERLAAIPDNMVRLGVLAGKEAAARQVSRRWLAQLEVLKKRYRDRMPVRVFYQVSDVPLFTLNGKHIVNEVIGLCGGRNVFAGLSVLAPHVSTEAVLAADPEVIVSTRGMGAHDGLAGWRRYTMLSAVRYGNLFAIHPDCLDRPGPRMITGTEMMCKALDEARANRQAAK